MNDFDIIIKKILKELDYADPQIIELDQGISLNIYISKSKTVTQYYVVSTCDNDYFKNTDFAELQKLIYKKIKELLEQEPAVDKNTSWLIGIECKDTYEDIMNKILIVEENPYYFKKMLCPYLTKEVSNFSEEVKKCSNLIEYLRKEIRKVSRFTDFYYGKGNDIAYDFLLRLLIKLPAIELQIKKEDDLRNLSYDIEQIIQENALNEMYKFLKDNIELKINMIDDNINSLHDLYYRKEKKDE